MFIINQVSREYCLQILLFALSNFHNNTYQVFCEEEEEQCNSVATGSVFVNPEKQILLIETVICLIFFPIWSTPIGHIIPLLVTFELDEILLHISTPSHM